MEINSLSASATSLITNAQNKVNTAAQSIATASIQKDEVGGSKDISSADLFKPVLSLKEAELENSAGVKVLKAEKEMLGTIIDIKA